MPSNWIVSAVQGRGREKGGGGVKFSGREGWKRMELECGRCELLRYVWVCRRRKGRVGQGSAEGTICRLLGGTVLNNNPTYNFKRAHGTQSLLHSRFGDRYLTRSSSGQSR